MKNIRVLIDTNIVLDWLMCREPFQENARFIMEKCLFGDLDGYLTAHSISDLFYILRKDFDVNKRKKLLLLLCDNMNVIIEDKDTIKTVLMNEKWTDFEDGLQMQCALREELEYIVTRNIKDFQDSLVMPVLPGQLIALYKSRQ
ncbi:PIN domain-containing protein [Enterocloster clostridioformis]|uniref:PIN domain-containing protein n=1 Tax=Enterocloster clostridioformis TaxID=1531 RepID=UPI0006779BE2|nr:PIN domain-containing protein [Enterocloster clostridioformis]